MSKLMPLGFVAALIVLTVGAGGSIAGPPQKTGSAVTLSLAAPEERGRPSSDIAEAFAACGIHVNGSAIGAGYTSRGFLSLRNP